MACTTKMELATMEDLSSKSLFVSSNTYLRKLIIPFSPNVSSSVEQTKFDSTPYDTTTWTGIRVKVPARIKYCKSIRAWVFTHEYIHKSARDDPDCPWLLRSEETDAYDIEEVQGPWQVWAGVISRTDGGYIM